MKPKLYLKVSYLFILYMTISCTGKVNMDSYVQTISKLECRAMELRNNRFELSDKIRLIEEGPNAERHQQELDSLYNIRDILKLSSLQLADSIKTELDILFKEVLSDKKLKTEFDSKLKSKMKECEAAPVF
ncbi:MAG: hypothetical protein IPM42_13230 [Saprospiraceae bacterium]|nr:hypothetical protein [Saprospiraceae bacterium]